MVLPVPEMDPALALQLTAVFEVPEIVAVKFCEPLAEMLAVPGEMDMETFPPPGVGDDGGPLLPQLANRNRPAAIATNASAR